jgi:hypothetical protein
VVLRSRGGDESIEVVEVEETTLIVAGERERDKV